MLLAHLVFFLILGVRASGRLQPIETQTYDYLLRLTTETDWVDPRIILISINEDDFDNWGWPISDALLLETLKTLQQQQPRVIGIDLFRSKPIPRSGQQSTTPDFEALNHFFAQPRNDNIIGIWHNSHHAYQQGLAPAPELAKGERAGVAGLTRDPDGIIRQGMLVLGKDISFSLLLALYYLYPDNIMLQSSLDKFPVKIGESTLSALQNKAGDYIPAEANTQQFLLDYQGIKKGFLSYTLSELLANKIPAQKLTDKLVIIGITSSIEKDYFYTPWSEDPQVKTRRESGIAIHGYSSSQILRIIKAESVQIQELQIDQEWLWLWLWCITGSYAAHTASSLLRFMVIITGGLWVISGLTYLSFISAWRIPVIPPMLGWVLTAIAVMAHRSNQEHHQRIEIERQFSRYISPAIAEQLWTQRQSLFESDRLRAQEFTATVFFTDIQGFTALSEGYSRQPEKLMQWLNTYMESMVDVVMEHHGMVNKLMGDGLMAVFGIPGPNNSLESIRQDATHAILCALEMEQVLSRLNQQWQQQNLPTVRIRIGIFTGRVVAGSLGSNDRLEYAIIGDTVNSASHLESYDKSYCHEALCRIMVGESTLTQIKLPLKKEGVGMVNLKGKQGKIKVYQILGIKP